MAEMRQANLSVSQAETIPGSAGDTNMKQPLAAQISYSAKAAIDIAVAFTTLLFLLPLLFIVAAAVSCDGGPIIFSHERVGLHGRKFRCLKFRSMVVDADKVLRELLSTDFTAAAEWTATQKLRRDPRVTKVGSFLRATSIDELPQLVNVLLREMSLVGPRPITASEQRRYGKHIGYYYRARPGITGLWQVSGRSDTTFSRRVALDRAYVKDWSLMLDLYILFRTIPAVLKRNGAH
jgi:Undecaprenyl-phosphate galactose phosphotransferase WbaP